LAEYCGLGELVVVFTLRGKIQIAYEIRGEKHHASAGLFAGRTPEPGQLRLPVA
jgi:hypothetical protein